MPIDDALEKVAFGEDRYCEMTIQAGIHASVEELLKDVVHDIVQEVVPGIVEEEFLGEKGYCMSSDYVGFRHSIDTHEDGRHHTRI